MTEKPLKDPTPHQLLIIKENRSWDQHAIKETSESAFQQAYK